MITISSTSGGSHLFEYTLDNHQDLMSISPTVILKLT